MLNVKIKRSLLEAAEEELRCAADEIKTCATLNGAWPLVTPEELDAKEHHDYLVALADKITAALR